MSAVVAEEPRLIHALPGRIRVHVPGLAGASERRLETHLRALPGVRSARANGLTSNILICFDPAMMDEQRLLTLVRTNAPDEPEQPNTTEHDSAATHPHFVRLAVIQERQGNHARARIAVREMESNPALAREVVARLERHPGVKATANPLTSRVLVQFNTHLSDIDDLLAEVSGMDLPDVPGEAEPTHPLDPGPLVQSATRTVGAALGFGFLAAQRLASGGQAAGGVAGAAQVSGVIGLLQGIPFVRYGLRRLLGRTTADLLVNVPNVVSLALSNNPLGLAVMGAESVRLLTETVARRAAWKRYEERLGGLASAEPGAVIRLETGERTPLAADIIEGTGNAIGRDAMPAPVFPGATVPAGARLLGGPFVLRLHDRTPFVPQPRPAPLRMSPQDRYIQVLGPLSLGYAALTAVTTRSFARTFTSLLLVNPRTAMIGQDTADVSAFARMLRSGVIAVDSRPHRVIRRPDLLLLDGPRMLTDGLELSGALPLGDAYEPAEVQLRAASIAAATGSPWAGAFRVVGAITATDGAFDGTTATATIDGSRYSLGPVTNATILPASVRLQRRGNHLLLLRDERANRPLGVLVLRPRLAPGVGELVETCRRHGTEIALLDGRNHLVAQGVARRADVVLLDTDTATEVIRARQATGAFVAFASDSAHVGEPFAAADLAIGVSSGRSSRFPARADLLAPDLTAVAAVVEAGARRDATARDAVGFSALATAVGAVWGFRGAPGIEGASRAVYITALGALADGWLRQRGGERSQSTIAHLVDPRPERWGRRSVASTLTALNTTEGGLTTTQAAQRHREIPPAHQRNALLKAVLEQLRSPLTGILAAGAGLSLFLGAPLDVAIIGATIAVNAAVGAWQEHQAGQAAEALRQMSTATARVLRDGVSVTLPATDIVPGDILLLATGDRVAADARIVSAQGLEVDEAALTGESLPVPKAPTGGTDASRVILEGSDVTVGAGRAAVIAVGRDTRMGATAAALDVDETNQSPLSVRLSTMLRQLLPLAATGGALVVGAGVLRGESFLSQLAIGGSIAVAAVPEGLPLLAGVGEAAVARRLVGRNALVRRLAAVEALGRVDIACTDKTGTLTEGRLALRLVADSATEAELPMPLSPTLRAVLLAAALASPHPDADDAGSHPTDIAVIRGAQGVGLDGDLRAEREREAPFDPARSFHATVAQGRLSIKGAAETLVPRCDRMRRGGADEPLDAAGRDTLLRRADQLAARGLRVLMVAEGAPEGDASNPEALIALGFVGIADPLRPSVRDAVRRCHAAGIRVVMLTGDSPATARAIAREAGLLDGHGAGDVLTGDEIAALENGDLDRRLEQAVVIARVTPLDKLRIVESLQRHGHTVAMTGDGVNDAPALRLADVGVAMGKGGTEVARQAADVVLADDDFATLVEALVEGRSFWRNIRRALGLLLGGNLGELGLVVGATVMGFPAPLLTRQILAVNLITDALPALSVALQPPENRNLAGLAREGTAALDAPLRRDVIRRGAATALPALAAYIITQGIGGLPQARAVAFASIVATQLAQTLDAGRSEGSLTRPVLAAVTASAGLLVAALTVAPLRTVLGLTALTPFSWALVGGGAAAAVLLSRLLASPGFSGSGQTRLRPATA